MIGKTFSSADMEKGKASYIMMLKKDEFATVGMRSLMN